MSQALKCPRCQASGGHLYGYEYPEIYDGVLVWMCTCGHAWSYWSAAEHGRRGAEAERIVAEVLQARVDKEPPQ